MGNKEDQSQETHDPQHPFYKWAIILIQAQVKQDKLPPGE
jgi:hypothetical protein